MKMGVLFVGRFENIRSIWFMLVRLFRFSHSNTDHLQFLKADRGRFLGTCPFCLRFKSILSRPCGALCSPVPECPWPPPHLLCTSVTSSLLLSLLRTGWWLDWPSQESPFCFIPLGSFFYRCCFFFIPVFCCLVFSSILNKKLNLNIWLDYAKAFDCVDHSKLWKILKEMGIPDHLTCL